VEYSGQTGTVDEELILEHFVERSKLREVIEAVTT
jgi:hypothetical protein